MNPWLQTWIHDFTWAAFAYFTIAGSFALFYLKPWFQRRLIRPNSNLKDRRLFKIFLSLQTLMVMALFAPFLYVVHFLFGYTPVYFEISDHGWGYYALSIVLMFVVVDSAYYWTHRLLHWRPLFLRAHYLHHRFVQINAWDTYSVHFIESVALALFALFLPALIFPWHPSAMAIYSAGSIFWITYLHCAHELIPTKWRDAKWTTWIYTSTHHYFHHQRPHTNYGLYFTFWDRWMQTELRAGPSRPRSDIPHLNLE
jgi:sterol desaturase/sphingolipid hydroxylase (fatty acid hydroxylase superfamily)